ncbi:hypothetical protein [Erythrobacter sp. JK5]|uniref:hypothetical protein n=1 Tax=Erythrobacter sp. JK5 TaxID=2829500 RepID=UPI001BA6AAB3|nr:hypothetical protein [Erythrobacter sp. JK5]QUL37893.1 hypothetical protein KDC96_00170 [Erythrobacter sp. JK5]
MPARIRERDLIIPALRAAAASLGGEITTTKLIEVMEDEFQPEGTDAQILDGRNDTYFSQKVRNLVSHRETSTSMFTRGYATYDAQSETIRITDLGRSFLDSVPQE